LDLIVINHQYLLAASMSGKLLLYDMAADKVLDERKDHSKYVVKLASWSDGPSTSIIATAGWDSQVILYRFNLTDGPNVKLGEPIARLSTSSIPETIVFIRSPDTATEPILLLTRRDSTCLYYYLLPQIGSSMSEFTFLGQQNLSPHSTAWVAFSVSDVRVCPTDESIVAVATSSTPHMRVIVVRLLIPPKTGLTSNLDAHTHGLEQSSSVMSDTVLEPGDTRTQASQERANLVIQDREEAAIILNINTRAPQTAYSTPTLVWRPDGSGIFVSSDDGVIRGLEAITGKLIVGLDSHEAGTKLRCLWAGYMKREQSSNTDNESDSLEKDEEYLISGGFDQKLILWSTL
jgi:WD40 repeat protein